LQKLPAPLEMELTGNGASKKTIRAIMIGAERRP